MSAYGSVNVMNKGFLWREILKKSITSFISSFSNTASFTINIPTNIYIRTKLICEYISDQAGIEFGIHDFLMTLYLDFINSNIKKYNPKKVYATICNSYGYNETITIIDDGKEFVVNKRDCSRAVLKVTMAKKDVAKGQLLLEELYDLFGHTVSFNKLLSNLWIGFIEEYKRGENSKALNAIIKMIKANLKDEY